MSGPGSQGWLGIRADSDACVQAFSQHPLTPTVCGAHPLTPVPTLTMMLLRAEFCLCHHVLFVRLCPPQPSPHWCLHQLRKWRRGRTEDPPGRCGEPHSAAHWRSARSSRWSACRGPPGPPAPLPAARFCWEAMASICHRACCWCGTGLSRPRHTAAPSSRRPCRSVQTWHWPHQLLGFRLCIQDRNTIGPGLAPSLASTTSTRGWADESGSELCGYG